MCGISKRNKYEKIFDSKQVHQDVRTLFATDYTEREHICYASKKAPALLLGVMAPYY